MDNMGVLDHESNWTELKMITEAGLKLVVRGK